MNNADLIEKFVDDNFLMCVAAGYALIFIGWGLFWLWMTQQMKRLKYEQVKNVNIRRK